MGIKTTKSRNYLLPKVRKLLQSSLVDRINHIKTNHWICYEKAKECLIKLEELIAHPKTSRMPNLLIIGDTNNGKSMIVEKFRKRYPKKILSSSEIYSGEVYRMFSTQVLVIQMPALPNIRRFYIAILKELMDPNYNLSDRRSMAFLESQVLEELKQLGVKVLVIDEIHNILVGTKKMQLEFLNVLRFLGNYIKIPLVGVGTKDAYLAIRSDPQLENRFEPFILPLWKNDIEYRRLLSSFVSLMPLKKESYLTQSLLAEIILDKSEGVIGEMVTLIKRAAIKAIELGEERITEKILREVNFHSPSGRKQMFENIL